MLLSPAGTVAPTVVVAVEPSALDSRDDTGLGVWRGVRASGTPEGAVVRREAVSAREAPPGGGAPVWGPSPAGAEDVGAVAIVGAAVARQNDPEEERD